MIRPPPNTGSKAGAQNFALTHVETELVMAIDADTTLAPDAIEDHARHGRPSRRRRLRLRPAAHVQTLWERGRYIEYLFAFTFYKPIQDLLRPAADFVGLLLRLPDRRCCASTAAGRRGRWPRTWT